MAEELNKRTPPYIPYRTFETFINGLADTSVPGKIDGSLLLNMSGSTRSGLMMALRYLGLVDENDNTKPALEKLAHAKGEERKTQLAAMMSAYGFLPNLDLKRATPAQLAEAIGKEGAGGGTREKAVAFFLRAAEAGGVEVSPHILKRKHAVNGGLRRIKRLPTKRKSDPPPLPPGHERTGTAGAVARTPYEVLMHDIYDPKAMKPGSEEEKAVFTLVRFLKSREVGA